MSEPQPVSALVKRMQDALEDYLAAPDETSKAVALAALARALAVTRASYPADPKMRQAGRDE